jgi:hypothetical protein
MRWSNNTFGIGPRFKGNMEHIRRELAEIEANPTDATEYADVIILTADTAMRQGISPHALCKALEEKQLVNFERKWNVVSDDEPATHKPECLPRCHEFRYSACKDMMKCIYCGKTISYHEFTQGGR